MKTYIANFGQSNYLWPACLERNTVATIDNEQIHCFWEAGNKAAFIDYATRHLKTARGVHPTKPVASRWYSINDAVSETAGDLWIHRDKDRIWWTISREGPVEVKLKPSAFPERDGPQIYEIHKPCDPWSNKNKKAGILIWDALHPKARDFLFTEGTLQQLSSENAEYAQALIAGADLTSWHDQSIWRSRSGNAKRSPVTVSDPRHRSAYQMADTVANTVAAANGQASLKTVKDKQSTFDKESLIKYVRALIDDQDGLCAITGIKLQFHDEEEDKELLCSLDRIDSSRGYEPENLQVVCRFVNRWKSDTADGEFRRLVKLVQNCRF